MRIESRKIKIIVVMSVAVFVGGESRSFGSGTDCGGQCAGSVSPPNAIVLMCPQGDTPSLSDLGVVVMLPFGAPVPEGSIHAADQCGNIAFSVPPQVDGPPDAGGTATFSGQLAGGGQTDTWLWWSGMIPEPPCLSIEVGIRLLSPDINGDLSVNLLDFALFGAAWPPGPYDPRVDYNGDSMISLVDFARFGEHFGH